MNTLEENRIRSKKNLLDEDYKRHADTLGTRYAGCVEKILLSDNLDWFEKRELIISLIEYRSYGFSGSETLCDAFCTVCDYFAHPNL